jgi:hypothetical protein
MSTQLGVDDAPANLAPQLGGIVAEEGPSLTQRQLQAYAQADKPLPNRKKVRPTKAPMPAYTAFCEDKRDEARATVTARGLEPCALLVGQELRSMWNTQTTAERAAYLDAWRRQTDEFKANGGASRRRGHDLRKRKARRVLEPDSSDDEDSD